MIYRKKMAQTVKPKKYLGQHFLADPEVAQRIAQAASDQPGNMVEVGPGMGALTHFLLRYSKTNVWAVELDKESCLFLKNRYPQLHDRLIEQDILTLDWSTFGNHIHIVGNFPYYISSQILFKALDYHDQVCTITCMLQKEVGARIAASHGNRTYGILSVLLQVYYDIRVLFDVPPEAFHPPPKVVSTVVQLTRNNRTRLECSEPLFRRLVKAGFQNRRKTLRNALKKLNLPKLPATVPLLNLRAEQLSVEKFIHLTQKFEQQDDGLGTL